MGIFLKWFIQLLPCKCFKCSSTTSSIYRTRFLQISMIVVASKLVSSSYLCCLYAIELPCPLDISVSKSLRSSWAFEQMFYSDIELNSEQMSLHSRPFFFFPPQQQKRHLISFLMGLTRQLHTVRRQPRTQNEIQSAMRSTMKTR